MFVYDATESCAKCESRVAGLLCTQGMLWLLCCHTFCKSAASKKPLHGMLSCINQACGRKQLVWLQLVAVNSMLVPACSSIQQKRAEVLTVP